MSIDYDLNGRLQQFENNAVAALPVWRQKPEWLCSLTVLEGDCDVLGHVNNVRYIRWLEAMSWQHSASQGLDWQAYQRFIVPWSPDIIIFTTCGPPHPAKFCGWQHGASSVIKNCGLPGAIK